jgi:hypothetical protein
MMPDEEKKRFERLIRGQADRFGISAEDYLRKVWYHEQASRLGEYIAMVLLDELLKLAPQEVAETLVETT